MSKARKCDICGRVMGEYGHLIIKKHVFHPFWDEKFEKLDACAICADNIVRYCKQYRGGKA